MLQSMCFGLGNLLWAKRRVYDWLGLPLAKAFVMEKNKFVKSALISVLKSK